jgi:hypothetical protein
MVELLQDVVAALGIEPEWTVDETDGVGFVACDLGTWLTVDESDARSPAFRAEVRLARNVPDNEQTREVVGMLNHEATVGCWVVDPESATLALVAGVNLSTILKDDTVGFDAKVVASIVTTAESLAYRSVPERDLGAAKAITLIGGSRRKGEHPLLREHLRAALDMGRGRAAGAATTATAGAATATLNLVQDVMIYLVPGWTIEHHSAETICENGDGFTLVVRVAEHPGYGCGLTIALGARSLLTMSAAEAHWRAFELNRTEARRPGLGCWAWAGYGLEYRTFLPDSLLELANHDLPEPRLVTGAIREAAARARPSLVPLRLVAANRQPILVRPQWDCDHQAATIARLEPINDGLAASDGYVWIDVHGRAAATAPTSFGLWRSRLLPEDLDHPGVVGYSEWFHREMQHRHGE